MRDLCYLPAAMVNAYSSEMNTGNCTLYHCTNVHEPHGISLISNDELITAPVLITAIRKVPSDDDGNFPAPF